MFECTYSRFGAPERGKTNKTKQDDKQRRQETNACEALSHPVDALSSVLSLLFSFLILLPSLVVIISLSFPPLPPPPVSHIDTHTNKQANEFLSDVDIPEKEF